MPLVDGGTEGESDEGIYGICWQDRSIDWNFENRVPDQISINYEGVGVDGAEGTLLMEFCEVDGLRIDTAGPYTLYPSGQIPWAGERPNPTAEAEDFARHRRSWRGDLVINVAGARAGDPSVTASARSAGAGREATTKATPSGEADDDDVEPHGKRGGYEKRPAVRRGDARRESAHVVARPAVASRREAGGRRKKVV